MILLLIFTHIAAAQEPDTVLLNNIDKKLGMPPLVREREIVVPSLRLPVPPPTSMEEILRSPLVQKSIRARGHVQDIQTEKIIAIDRSVIVNVYSLTDDHGFFYIVNDDGKTTQRVHLNYATGIQTDIAMYEEPRRYTPVIERKNVSPFDRPLLWKPEVSMLLGRTSADWTADVLDDTQARNATGYQFGARWLADLQGKFQLGASLHFSGSQHNLSAGEATYRNYAAGVIMKSRSIEWGGFPWRVYGEYMWGPWGVLAVRTAAGREDIQLRSSSLVLGWERPYQNSIGEWSWGLSWQRDWPKLRNQTIFIRQDSSSSTNDIIGLHLTQGFSW